jgi:hypothetical protein
MAVERQGGKERYECRVLSPERWVWGKEDKRREISPDGRDDKGEVEMTEGGGVAG